LWHDGTRRSAPDANRRVAHDASARRAPEARVWEVFATLRLPSKLGAASLVTLLNEPLESVEMLHVADDGREVRVSMRPWPIVTLALSRLRPRQAACDQADDAPHSCMGTVMAKATAFLAERAGVVPASSATT